MAKTIASYRTGARTMTEVELTSAKYFKTVMKEEKTKRRKERDKNALYDFATFVIGMGAMVVGVHAVQVRDQWMPIVLDLLP